MIIKRVEPLSAARILGALYAALGLLFGALFSLFALLGGIFSSAVQGPAHNALSPFIGGVIGVGAIAIFPIMYGLMGFLFAWLGAVLYNFVASRVGGIQIEVA